MARRPTLKVLALLPALALGLATAGCAEKIDSGAPAGGSTSGGASAVQLIESGKLKVCTHLPYKPFQFSEGGKTVGFDVDLVDLIAKDLGATQEIVDTPFEGSQSGEDLNTRKCDLVAAGMTITDVRKKNLDFTDPYFEATQVLMVKKGGPKTLADLKGKKLGVQQATTGEEYATKNKDANGYDTVQFEDLALELTAVKTGQIDAAINDNGVILDFVKDNPDTEVTAQFQTGEQYGFGIRKGNAALLAKANEVLAKAKSSGEYDKVYEKWFGKKPTK
ncbi:polar amino acid transport system substrate-binding protein [Kibdelosporangium banguiense]|uniref:Polar amino acid transport system substrate-binding protein n=1 Tax=Kibdelosporangium banguiense TaxID=1365924 RepID=A0ABS4TC04_9PSEU|nr:basic amino acid ABC transporter substrate-binding protein [Kibdelosporangium banguiense]MBP2321963.1 polar amino acid transport system substrate-binding protein [Kibdelosporangium banguiense]